ncbi:MAG: GNAT family N-acetyltransferase [Gemmatimonadaceae bacterium]
MQSPIVVAPVTASDYDAWLPLWNGYNAFYGREGPTALPREITQTTWRRFLDPDEPVHALVASSGGTLVGLAHYLFHRSTTRLALTCYMQDLFTTPEARGHGVGRALIEAVYAAAAAHSVTRVYWQTQVTNEAGRRLYDKVARHLGFIVYVHDA